MTPEPFRLNVLGPVTVERAGGGVLRSILAQPRRLALLVYLALARSGDFLSRDHLLARFWPDADGDRARNALRQSLHFLRRALGAGAIVTRADSLAVADAVVRCDARIFDRHLGAGRPEHALRLVRGAFLEDLPLFGLPAIDDWCAETRRGYRRKGIRAATDLSRAAAHAGERVSAVDWARRATAFDPYSVPAVLALVDALAHAGDVAAALRTAQAARERLRRDLDLEPPDDLTRAIDGLRAVRPDPDARHIRLTLQLFDAASGSRLWSGVFDRPIDQAHAIRSEVARTLAAVLPTPPIPLGPRPGGP